MSHDQTFSVDPFAAASAAAITDLSSSLTPSGSATPSVPETTPEAPAAPEDVVGEEATPPVPAIAEEEATVETPPPAEAKAEKKWVLERKGQKVEVSDEEELTRLAQMGFDYTQKTQALSAYEKELRRQAQELVEYYGNKENLRQILEQQEQAAQPPPDPHDVPTIEQTRQMIAEEQLKASTRLQQQQLEAETVRYEQTYRAEIDSTLRHLLNEKHPMLRDVDKIEKLLLDDVAEEVFARVERDPTHVVPPEQIRELLAKSAERRELKLKTRFQDHEKMRLVRDAKLRKAIEPPGGGAPPPAAAPPQNHRLGSKELTQLVTEELAAAFSRKT